MFELRPYQSDLRDRCRDAFRAGHKRVVMQLGTGGGKTCTAADVVRLAVLRGHRVLYTAHRDEILTQTAAKLADAGVVFAVLSTGRAVPDAAVILASQQTLARRDVPAVDLHVCDEAHQGTKGQARVQAALPNAWHLLLTATPCRLDGNPLPADAIVCGPSVAELQAAGHLCEAIVYSVPAPDVADVAMERGDFKPAGLAIAARKPALVGAVADNWRRYCTGRRGVLFAVSVEHSRECCAALTAAGYRAVHVDGSTPDAERSAAWAGLRSGTLDCVCNVGVAIEGLDVPEIDAVYMARPTCSLTVHMQSIGRGMRPAPGKRDLVVVDAAGNTWRHGLPETPREWSLTARVGAVRGAALPGLSHCAECLAMWDGGGACPRCGHVATAAERAGPRTVGGELLRVTAAELERRARAASKDVPPRDCPAWVEAAGLAGYWRHCERDRAANGHALPSGGRFTGYSESRCFRRMKGAHRAA